MNLNYTKNKFIGILTNDKEGHHYEGIQSLEKLQSKKFKPKIMKKLAEGSKKCNIYFLFIFHMVTNASFSTVIPLTHNDLQTLLNNHTYSPSSSMYNLYASLTHAHRIRIHGYTKFMQRQKYVYKHISYSHQHRHTVT